MPALLPFLVQRLKEPSTYAGIGVIAAAVGWHFSPAQLDALAALGMAAAGLAAVFVPEGAAKTLLLPAMLVGLGLSACTAAQQQKAVAVVDAGATGLQLACGEAMQLAPAAGQYAPFILAGCGTSEAIAKLATDPQAQQWVGELIGKVRALTPQKAALLWPENGALVTMAGE